MRPHGDRLTGIDAWRARMVRTVLRVLLIAGVVVAVPSTGFALATGQPVVVVVDVVALASLAVLAFAPRLRYRTRALGLILIVYLVGVSLLSTVGLVSQIYLLAVPVFTALLIGVRASVVALVVNAVTVVTAGMLGGLDRLALAGVTGTGEWVVITINFMFVNAVLTLSCGILLRHLGRSLEEEHAATELLAQERADLQMANHDLIEAQERATAVEAQLTQAMESMTDAVYLLDRSWVFTYANPRAAQVLQRDASEILGEVVWTAFPEAVDSPLHEALRRAMDSGTTEQIAPFFYAPLDRWIQATAYPTPQGLAVYFLDVTEQRRIEQQLAQAQRMESIGTLAAGIAHDLNNVLAPILLAVQLLADQEDDPVRSELLGTVEASTRRGAAMVRQVQSFAEGVSGDQEDLDIAGVLAEALHLATKTFPRHIAIVPAIDDGLATVRGDATQIHQVVMNLLVNARDALPAGGTITCRAATVDLDSQYLALTPDVTPGTFVRIEIEDDGQGMTAAVADRIFEPFYTTKPHGEGSGLGLSTARAIVSSHGGLIRVASEPGRGTTVRVHLPAVEAPVDPPRRRAPTNDGLRARGECLLLVDDEDAILEITQRTLEAFGYRVITASDGAEAVALFVEHAQEIDLLLTDMMMPIMDGPSLIRALRRLNPTLPVIAASGLHAANTPDRGSADHVQHRLAKPYSATELLTVVRRVLDDDGPPAPPAETADSAAT